MIIALLLAAATAIPHGFLLHEDVAVKRDTTSVRDEKNYPLAVDPCGTFTLGRSGRTAARSLRYATGPETLRYEQVVVYSSEAAARTTVERLRAATRKCGVTNFRYATRTVRLGDEGLSITGQGYQDNKPILGLRAIVTRRANALIIYSVNGPMGRPAKSDFNQLTKDTKRMLTKICRVAAC